MRACDLRLNTSKTYPDKVGICDLAAKLNGMPLATARKRIKEKLAPVMKRGADGIKLVSLKGEQSDEGEE